MDDGKSREFQPFVEVNWLHNSKDFSTSMDGVSVTQDGARNIAEIKTGVEGQLNANLNVWGNVGVQDMATATAKPFPREPVIVQKRV